MVVLPGLKAVCFVLSKNAVVCFVFRSNATCCCCIIRLTIVPCKSVKLCLPLPIKAKCIRVRLMSIHPYKHLETRTFWVINIHRFSHQMFSYPQLISQRIFPSELWLHWFCDYRIVLLNIICFQSLRMKTTITRQNVTSLFMLLLWCVCLWPNFRTLA